MSWARLSKQIVTVLVFIAAVAHDAQAQLPPGFESYSTRPDILSVTPRPHAEYDSDWPAVREGIIEFAAQIAGLYPTEHLYFIGRDGELLYDALRVLFRHDSAMLARLHLINVSRRNVDKPHLLEYLAQEGISEEALTQGRQIVLLESGTHGRIPSAIRGIFSNEHAHQFRFHLLLSMQSDRPLRDRGTPSSRTFMRFLARDVNRTPPSDWYVALERFEYLPHHTDRSTGFAQDDAGHWVAISPVDNASDDGDVNPARARRFQEDLSHNCALPETVDVFRNRTRQWTQWRTQFLGGQRAALVQDLSLLLSDPSTPTEHERRESAIRDFVEWSQANASESCRRPVNALRLYELGLTSWPLVAHGHTALGPTEVGSVPRLRAEHPEWSGILLDPIAFVFAWIQEDRIPEIASLMNQIRDTAYLEVVCLELAHSIGNEKVRQAIVALIDRTQPRVWQSLARFTLSTQEASQYPELVQALTAKGGETLETMIRFVYANRSMAPHLNLLRNALEVAGDIDLRRVATDLGGPAQFDVNDIQYRGILHFLIAHGGSEVRRQLNRRAFALALTQVPEFELLRQASRALNASERTGLLRRRLQMDCKNSLMAALRRVDPGRR